MMMSKPLLHLFTQVMYTGQAISDWACSCGSNRIVSCCYMGREHQSWITTLVEPSCFRRWVGKEAVKTSLACEKRAPHNWGKLFLFYTMRTVMG